MLHHRVESVTQHSFETEPKDFALANATSLGFDIFNIGTELLKSENWIDPLFNLAKDHNDSRNSHRNGIFATRTWHHHEIIGVMELVDSKKHNKGHYGGIAFYQVLTNETYGQ